MPWLERLVSCCNACHSLPAHSIASFGILLVFCILQAARSGTGSAAALLSDPIASAWCFGFLFTTALLSASRSDFRLSLDLRRRPQLMHNNLIAQRRRLRARSSARPCKRQGGSADQAKRHSKEPACTDCYSQPNSVESVSSTAHMHGSGDGDVHLESSLQCEEHNQCLSSPQDSDTSAQSYHDASALSSTPVTAARQHPFQRPFTSEPIGPSLAEVPPYALTETYNIASFGKQHLRSSCIAAAFAVLHSSMLPNAYSSCTTSATMRLALHTAQQGFVTTHFLCSICIV